MGSFSARTERRPNHLSLLTGRIYPGGGDDSMFASLALQIQREVDFCKGAFSGCPVSSRRVAGGGPMFVSAERMGLGFAQPLFDGCMEMIRMLHLDLLLISDGSAPYTCWTSMPASRDTASKLYPTPKSVKPFRKESHSQN